MFAVSRSREGVPCLEGKRGEAAETRTAPRSPAGVYTSVLVLHANVSGNPEIQGPFFLSSHVILMLVMALFGSDVHLQPTLVTYFFLVLT